MSATVTASQNAYNLKTARNIVAAQLGIEDSTSIDYSDRVTYNRTLAGFILQHPNGFTDAQLKSAAIIANTDYPTLADPSFDWSQFGEVALQNVVPTLDGFTNKLLVVLAVVGVAWVFFREWFGAPDSSPATAAA